jgi:endonuclease-3
MDVRGRKKLLTIFEKLYPAPRSELDFTGEYQLLVAVVLSAQCTDRKVNQVTPELFERYPDFEALAGARLEELEGIIRPINYYKTKARNLIATGKRMVVEYKGALPVDRDGLVSLPGVGRKTANVVLSELGLGETFPVDTHVFRVSKRLGLAHGNTPEKVEQELMALFDSSSWRNLHHWLIFHGRRVCKAQNPYCAGCSLNTLCPSVQG